MLLVRALDDRTGAHMVARNRKGKVVVMFETVGSFMQDVAQMLPPLGLVVYFVLSYDGMRLVFRGSRDYAAGLSGRGVRSIGPRLAAGLAAIALFASGFAPVITVVAWFSGVPMFRSWPDSSRPSSVDQPTGQYTR